MSSEPHCGLGDSQETPYLLALVERSLEGVFLFPTSYLPNRNAFRLQLRSRQTCSYKHTRLVASHPQLSGRICGCVCVAAFKKMLSQIRKCDAATEQEEAGSEWHCTTLRDKMSGPRLKTPLLFLLLLLSSLTGTAFCEDEDAPEPDADISPTTQAYSINNDGNSDISVSDYSPDSDPSAITPTTPPYDGTEDSGSGEPSTLLVSDSDHLTDSMAEEGGDIITILIPVLAVIIVGVIIFAVVIVCRRRQKAGTQESSKEDPHLEGSSTEKVPMPMFEEDVPSVLELEMDELDQWMKKDS